MVKVLQVYPQLNNAGTEMVIMNLFNNINQNEVHFDFLIQNKGVLDDKIKETGAKIYYIPNNGKEYKKNLKAFFEKHNEYKAVHTHTHAEMALVLNAAKKAGIKYRIAHSHNSREDLPKILKLYKRITSIPIERNANRFLACSKLAARWLFPHKYKECKVVENAIELEKFSFNEETRKTVRANFGFKDDDIVICHVGRFAEQKNHRRIIELLNKLIEQNEKVHALLVGDGPLLDEMKNKAKSESIVFLGNRSDVPDILCAADMFLFPSLHEGLGIVLIEAQASGLHCVASTAVPSEADIGLGILKRLSLKEADEVWLNAVISSCNNGKREELSQSAVTSNYNIKKIGKYMEKFYLELK